MVGSRLRHNPRHNLPGTVGDKPARGIQKRPPANGSDFLLPAPLPANSYVSTPATSCTPTLAPTSTPAFAFMPMPVKYIDADFHQFIKVFMNFQERSGTYKGPQKSLLKAHFLDLYYRKSHMDCYQFCQ